MAPTTAKEHAKAAVAHAAAAASVAAAAAATKAPGAGRNRVNALVANEHAFFFLCVGLCVFVC